MRVATVLRKLCDVTSGSTSSPDANDNKNGAATRGGLGLVDSRQADTALANQLADRDQECGGLDEVALLAGFGRTDLRRQIPPLLSGKR